MRWLADENFNNDILRALFRGHPEIDVVRAQDAGLTGVDDETPLAWAADRCRVLPTHDVSTITAHAYRRVMKGNPMPGVFEVSCDLWLRTAVEDILLLTECSHPDKWEGQVRYLPLRQGPLAPNCIGAAVARGDTGGIRLLDGGAGGARSPSKCGLPT